MYKFGLVVLAVVACVQAASVPSEFELDVAVSKLQRSIGVPSVVGRLEAVKECVKGQLEKVKALAQHTDESLKKCAGKNQPEVHDILEDLQAAFNEVFVVGAEAADRFPECLHKLPNLIEFNRCTKDILKVTAGSTASLVGTLKDTVLGFGKLGVQTLACGTAVVDETNKALIQINLESLKCLTAHE